MEYGSTKEGRNKPLSRAWTDRGKRSRKGSLLEVRKVARARNFQAWCEATSWSKGTTKY